MNHLKLFASAVVAISLGVSGVALAGSPADYFGKIDANADGNVTEAEFVAYKTADGKYTAEDAASKYAKLSGGDGTFTLVDMEASMEKAKSKKDCKDKAATNT